MTAHSSIEAMVPPFLCFLQLVEKGSIHLDYDQKIQLLALYKQEKYGRYSPEKDEETGYFDIIGGDRRWGHIHTVLILVLAKFCR